MSYDHVRDRTSAAVGTDEDSGVLFDETISAYSQRRKRAEEFLSEALIDSHRKAFKAYLHRPQWSTIADDAASGERRRTGICAPFIKLTGKQSIWPSPPSWMSP